MTRLTLAAALVLGILLMPVTGAVNTARAQGGGKGQAGGMDARPVAQTPEWKELSSLVGAWDGWFSDGGKKADATVEVRMTGDGSAVMHVLGKDTPHEMVTMFHPDGTRLLATHYCAAHNQPRMALVPAKAPNQLAFEFVDGTNIAPGDTHMLSVVLTFLDADHHDETWTSQSKGAVGPPAVFHFTRKKK